MNPTNSSADALTETYGVRGMSCAHCVSSVREEVSPIAGVQRVEVHLHGGVVVVYGRGFADAAIRAAIDEAGYEVTS